LINPPRFADEAPTFLKFIADAPLIIHNASFDIGFINHELERLGPAQLSTTRVVDTLALARRRHPACPHSLDALCKRYGSTIRSASSTAPSWTHCCWRLSTSSCWASANHAFLGGHGRPAQAGGAAHGRARQRPVPLQTRVTPGHRASPPPVR
jgi:DNA polymerase-3 subunit epsilon